MPIEAFLVIPSGGSNPTMTAEPVTDRYFGSAFRGSAVIAVDSFDFGVENTSTIGSSTSGAGAGRSTFDALTVRKGVDVSSPSLFSVSAGGRHFTTVQLYLRASGSPTGKPYLGFELQTVYISKIEWSGSSGDDAPIEIVSLIFAALAIGYRDTNPDGSFATPSKGSWNVTTNAPVPDTLILN